MPTARWPPIRLPQPLPPSTPLSVCVNPTTPGTPWEGSHSVLLGRGPFASLSVVSPGFSHVVPVGRSLPLKAEWASDQCCQRDNHSGAVPVRGALQQGRGAQPGSTGRRGIYNQGARRQGDSSQEETPGRPGGRDARWGPGSDGCGGWGLPSVDLVDFCSLWKPRSGPADPRAPWSRARALRPRAAWRVPTPRTSSCSYFPPTTPLHRPVLLPWAIPPAGSDHTAQGGLFLA